MTARIATTALLLARGVPPERLDDVMALIGSTAVDDRLVDIVATVDAAIAQVLNPQTEGETSP